MPHLVRSSLRRLVVLTVPLALTAGALAAGSAAAQPATGKPSGPSPTVPSLNWTPCPDAAGFECATATVPLDYSKPRGQTISIALTRLPASNPGQRIGSMFVNPGGPGGPGVEFVQSAAEAVYSEELRARFDIVGFDPRFVGASRPLATCVSDEEFIDLFGELPAFPITRAQERATHRANARFSELCAERSPFLAHAATANVARDLDLLRQAVGDRKLTYAGYSYGSILGQTYAALFPGKVRALTIDGVLDNQAWSTGAPGESRRIPFTTRIDSAFGAYDTFEQFTKLCDNAGTEGCVFTADGDARTKYDELAARLKAEPLALPDGSVVDYAILVAVTTGVLYDSAVWQDFAVELQAVYELVFGVDSEMRTTATDQRTAAAKAMIDRAESDPRWIAPNLDTVAEDPPLDSGLALFAAVTCSDSINPRSERAWAAAGAAQDRVTPYFGRYWTWAGETCASWQLPGKGRYLGPYNRATSSPVLVVAPLYDPATPYSGGQAAAAAIPGARLLTVDGYGHTSLNAVSACAAAYFDAYTITGRTPPRGAVCDQDVLPFATD